MRTQVLLQPCYILLRRPYRNTSLLLECFTLDYGRVTVIARGVRGPRSRYKGLLQPFYPLVMSWGGKSDLVYLNKVESEGMPHLFKGLALLSAFYLNELLIRLLKPRDPHREVFLNYRQTLTVLSQGGSVEAPLRIFEKKLLQAIGYGLNLSKDAFSGAVIEPDGFYQFIPERGFQKVPLSIEFRQRRSDCFMGSHLLAFAREDCSDKTVLSDAKRLMRQVLKIYLGDRPLHTKSLYQKTFF